jgi:hypothetical protein
MAEWKTCPACKLRHTGRPDGLCPKCKQPVDAFSAPADIAPDPVAAEPSPAPSVAGLGRLAQSARGDQLKSARTIMLFVGIMSVVVNLFFYASAEQNVQTEIDKEIKKLPAGFVADPVKIQEVKGQAVRAAHLINGGGAFLGIVFIVCGVLVHTYPVPTTITALVLYLGGNAVFGMLNPQSLASGLIVKVFIVVGLFKAVQAALAFQKELAAEKGM